MIERYPKNLAMFCLIIDKGDVVTAGNIKKCTVDQADKVLPHQSVVEVRTEQSNPEFDEATGLVVYDGLIEVGLDKQLLVTNGVVQSDLSLVLMSVM